MSKWKIVATNSIDNTEETKEEKARRARKFDNVIRNTKRLKEEEYVKESEAYYEAEQERKKNLVAAYEAKKLKSKDAIKEARSIMRTAAKSST